MSDRIGEIEKAFKQPEWYLKGRSYHVRMRIETVKKFLENSQHERILDIGCGDGSISLPLVNKNNSLTLLDMSEQMLALAQARIHPELISRVNIMKGDFISAHLETESYDLIICLGVLSYIDDVIPFLQKLIGLLRPGGTIILEWTDSSHFLSRLLNPYHAMITLIRGERVRLAKRNSAEVINEFAVNGIAAVASHRYGSPLPVLRRLLGQELSYRGICMIYGRPGQNRTTWLADECIYQFKKPKGDISIKLEKIQSPIS